MEKAVGDGGLVGTLGLTTPKASELGSWYCITRYGELEKVLAGEDCSRECKSELEYLSSHLRILLSMASNC
jgi:hypothetical protein